MVVLDKLAPQDIDEKIRLNEDIGYDIFKLLISLKEELKDFRWAAIRAQVQCQCLTEQISHLEKRIKEYQETGLKNWEAKQPEKVFPPQDSIPSGT